MVGWIAFWLQAAVVVIGAASAGAWAKSASVKIPSLTTTTWDGGGAYPAAMAVQGLWNKRAAFLAAIASFVQAVTLLLTMSMPPH